MFVDGRTSLRSFDEAANNGETPLHHAAFHGLEKEVEALLAAGADTQLAGYTSTHFTRSLARLFALDVKTRLSVV